MSVIRAGKSMIKLIHGDCLEVMKTIPDKSIDLVLTDPPYGIGEDGLKNHSRGCKAETTKFIPKEHDREIPEKIYFDELLRISKNQIIFGGNYFIEYLKNTSCILVWDKLNGETDFADCELMWTSFKSAVRKYEFRWQGMLQGNMKNKQIRKHPNEKPIELLQMIIRDYSNENDLIFDGFMGSGTCGLACWNMKRRFIGVEIDKGYFDIASKRIADAQNTLFDKV